MRYLMCRGKQNHSMKRLTQLLSAAALMTVASGVASADTLISYTVTIPATATDLTNILLTLPGWNPGGASSTASDTTSYVSTQPGFVSGVTMAGLNAPGTTYTLQSYDILLKATLSGSFTTMNMPDASSSATGTVHLDTYTSAALGSPNNPDLTNTTDPANDLFQD